MGQVHHVVEKKQEVPIDIEKTSLLMQVFVVHWWGDEKNFKSKLAYLLMQVIKNGLARFASWLGC